MHGIDVVVVSKAGQQPRQRGLGRPILDQWRHAARITAGQLPERITAQRVGIAEIDPPHRPLQHQGAYLAGQRVANTQRMPYLPA